MKMKWVIVFLPLISVLGISLAVHEHAAKAAPPPAVVDRTPKSK